MSDHPRLRMVGVRKRFGATDALRGVDLEVRAGEIHALIGENGAGKSTLMKILSGAIRPDDGSIELDGTVFDPDTPYHARKNRIGMMHQELNLAPHLTVEENVLLGESRRCGDVFGWLNKRQRRTLARDALTGLHHEDLPLDTPVHRLSVAQQQIVEIARVLIADPRVLIMDEPTSSLTRQDTENLFAALRRLRQRGVSIIYISHFLEECRALCDRYTVLRDGRSVATGEMATTTLQQLIAAMVGREIKEVYPRIPRTIGEPLLRVDHIAGLRKPRGVSFNLRAGEIFGIAGLIGAGRTETLRACFGLDRLRDGQVLVDGKDCTHASPRTRMRRGLGMLSENRKEEGLFLQRSVADNLTISHLGPFSRGGLLRQGSQRECANRLVSRFGIRTNGARQSVGELSGGNQQKVAFARLIHQEARILLLDEPTRGIDIGSKTEIYRWMGELARDGRAIVFVSSYVPELLAICDTVGVMYRGALQEVRPAAAWTEEDIIRCAVAPTKP